MICLDTNAVIDLLNVESSPVLALIDSAAAGGERITVSSIVVFELWYGVRKSARRAENADRIVDLMSGPIQVLDFDPDDAEEAGDIRATLNRAGTPIGPYDVLIAAQARRRDALLVTANTREFKRVPRLRIEDWSTALEGEK